MISAATNADNWLYTMGYTVRTALFSQHGGVYATQLLLLSCLRSSHVRVLNRSEPSASEGDSGSRKGP
jgi:hypothetical protein